MKDKKLQSMKTVIRTKDFDKSKHFYTQILQLKIVEEYDDGNDLGCIVQLGDKSSNAFIEISEIAKDNDYFHESFAIESQTDKVDMQIKNYWAKRLKENKIESRGSVLRPSGFHYLYPRDPDNSQIINYEE